MEDLEIFTTTLIILKQFSSQTKATEREKLMPLSGGRASTGTAKLDIGSQKNEKLYLKHKTSINFTETLLLPLL